MGDQENVMYRLIATVIERVAKNWVTTIAGAGGITATFLGQMAPFVPDKYRGWLIGGGAVLGGVAAILAKDGHLVQVKP